MALIVSPSVTLVLEKQYGQIIAFDFVYGAINYFCFILKFHHSEAQKSTHPSKSQLDLC